jgi:DNA polymerase-1
MTHEWNLDVPPPLYVHEDDTREVGALIHLLLSRMRAYPQEPIGFDTETHGLKIPIKGTYEQPKPSDPLDWIQDTVTFWSLSARMDGDTWDEWVEYVHEFHPEILVGPDGETVEPDPYARWCLPCNHLHRFAAILENPEVILATWNGKYDAHVCWNSGINLFGAKVWDLLVAGFLLDENLQGNMGLKARAEKWVGLHMTKFTDLFGDVVLEDGSKAKEFVTDLRLLPLVDVIHYASYDAYATLKLYEYLKENLEQERIADDYSMWDYYLDMEVPCTEVLWRMERRGLPISLPMLQEARPRAEEEVKSLKMKIVKATGNPNINIRSPKQLVHHFFGPKNEGGKGYKPLKMTKRGGKTPSTDESVLSELALRGDDVAGTILRVRKVDKILGTYINALEKMAIHHPDGRIHPSFNQYGARTGRFSTSAPNSQNFPRPDGDEFGIRKMFIARPGWKLLVGDYGQLEMRIMAHMSKDKYMLHAIKEGMDLHCYTVGKMFNGISYDEVMDAKNAEEPTIDQQELKKLRQHAKAIGFGLIYGAGAPKIAQQLEIEIDEAQDKIDAYFDAFPGVAQFIDYTHVDCKDRGFVSTILGRRRRLPDINSHIRELRGVAERESVNSIIQGTASDITKAAMLNIEFDLELNYMSAWMLNQIHDELVIEIPEEFADLALPRVQHFMEFPFQGEEALCVPTPVDLHIVDNWAEAK